MLYDNLAVNWCYDAEFGLFMFNDYKIILHILYTIYISGIYCPLDIIRINNLYGI